DHGQAAVGVHGVERAGQEVHVGFGPAADDLVWPDQVERGEVGIEDVGDLHRATPSAGATSKLNIIPLSWCSAMWQCAIQRPGLVTSRRMSTVSPVRTRTVSFQTRFGSTTSSRARTRNRPAPWTWKGCGIG